jgi:hypothetical protein
MTICLFLVSHLALGSGEVKIGFDTVTLGISEHKMEIKMTHKDGEKFDFQVRISDKIIKISPEFLFDAKVVDPQSIRVIVVSNPGAEVRMENGFIVSFVVAGTYDHGKNVEGEDVTVRRVIRLHFKDGELRRSVMAIPSGNFKNEWHFLERDRPSDGSAVVETDNGYVESSVRCPWTTSVEPGY